MFKKKYLFVVTIIRNIEVHSEFLNVNIRSGAWGSVVVKTLRY